MATPKTAGFSYPVGELFVSFVGNRKPFNIDTIKALQNIWIEVKTDDGEGTVAPKVVEHKSSGPLTHMQEKQGLQRETVCQLSVPKGEEDRYFQVIKRNFGNEFTVSKLDGYKKPETKKASSEKDDFKKLDELQQKALKLLKDDKLEEAKEVQKEIKVLFDKLYEVRTMGKGSSVVDRIARQHTIAHRIVKKSYMVLKVPVGYSFIHNAKAIIGAHTGAQVEDEDLEAIIARFLDLVIFSLTKDPEHAGDTMPTTDQFFQIVDEVLQSSENRYFNDDEEDDLDRYDEDEDLDEDDDEEGDEGRF